jgi:hypothetical protein
VTDLAQTDAANDAGRPVFCSVNHQLIASAFCTVCRKPFSGRYIGVRRDGRAVCHPCAQREGIDLVDSGAPAAGDPVLKGRLRDIFFRIAVTTAETFARDFNGPLGPSLRFGYITTVIGYAAALGWIYLLRYDAFIAALTEVNGASVPPELMPWAPWLGLPVTAAMRLVVGVTLMHAGFRMVGVPAGTFSQHARLFALTSVSLLLCAVPVLGPFFALAMWMNVSMTYLRSRYAISPIRSMLATLPCLLVLTLVDPVAWL